MHSLTFGKLLLLVIVLIASIIVIEDRLAQQWPWLWGEEEFHEGEMVVEDGVLDESCQIAGIALHGQLATYALPELLLDGDLMASSEQIMYQLEVAEDDPHIKAILLEIDSYGGNPVAARELVDTLTEYVSKPVVAHIRSGGLSAAYWVAAAADHINATKYSDIGSIGVTMSYVDESMYNELTGLTFNEINSGKFKDSGSASKSLTEEEKALFQRDIDVMYQGFVDDVAALRGLERDAVLALADGSSMLGDMALERGLIDSVGSYYDTLRLMEREYGAQGPVCWQ